MEDGSPRRRAFPGHSLGVDFYGEGTSHFSSSGEQIWNSIWNEHKIIARSYSPYIYPNDYLNTVFDDIISLRGSCRNNALPGSLREKLELVAVLSLRVKSLSGLEERNMLIMYMHLPRQTCHGLLERL